MLIRIETRAGHGGGKPASKKIEEAADELSLPVQRPPGGGGRRGPEGGGGVSPHHPGPLLPTSSEHPSPGEAGRPARQPGLRSPLPVRGEGRQVGSMGPWGEAVLEVGTFTAALLLLLVLLAADEPPPRPASARASRSWRSPRGDRPPRPSGWRRRGGRRRAFRGSSTPARPRAAAPGGAPVRGGGGPRPGGAPGGGGRERGGAAGRERSPPPGAACNARLTGLYRLGRQGYFRLFLSLKPDRRLLPLVRLMRYLARRDRAAIDRYQEARVTAWPGSATSC